MLFIKGNNFICKEKPRTVKRVKLGNAKLISCLAIHGKKSMRDALKSFYFRLRKVNAQKGIFFLFYQIVMETLFYETI